MLLAETKKKYRDTVSTSQQNQRYVSLVVSITSSWIRLAVRPEGGKKQLGTISLSPF